MASLSRASSAEPPPAAAPAVRAPMSLTHHSQVRLQQRGIPRWYVDTLVTHGRHCHAPGGAEIVCIDKGARQRLGRSLSRQDFARAERYFNVYAVVAPGGVLVTVARWQRGSHRPD